ncbi:hypothetical protein [Flagellimonas eckloniae]|uniref:Uncharacterized protein n=1 Tax=Flagellimonas eckloniae TaxID=346185 RepID=A0A0Q0WTI2_9FLAO|nr:hypothetical protein [Allomuricauda eckloniae]KQC28644.1 hypothetical protein AAY42_01035 [Allomuricauda eckloniae]
MKTLKVKNYILTGVLIFSLAFSASAQQEAPLNSSYLSEHGISPKILDAAASVLLQEGSFIQNLEIEIDNTSGKEHLKTQIIYDPSYKDGKDIRFVIEQGEFSKPELKALKKAIEKSHKLSRLSRKNLYDESSLKLLSNSQDQMVFGFRYSKNDIEPELKDIKKYKGKLFLSNGVLDKVELTSDSRLSGGKENFKRIVHFKKADNRKGYIVSGIKESYDTKNGAQNLTFTTADYKAPDGTDITWEGKSSQPFFEKDVAIDTVNVTLGWVLPIFGKPATKLGYGLPRPVGLNVILHSQDDDLDFEGISVGFGDGDLADLSSLFDLQNSNIVQTTTTYFVRPDVWIFPFLNVAGIFGRADNTVAGDFILDEEFRQGIVDLAPFLGLDPSDIPQALPLNIDVSANIIGGSVTLGGGIGDVFFSGTYQYIRASVEEANTTTNANAYVLMAGYRFPNNLNIFAGSMGQYYDSDVAGFFELDSGDTLRYNVNFTPTTWNAIMGVNKGFGKHWDLMVQLGVGGREQLTAQLGYRF